MSDTGFGGLEERLRGMSAELTRSAASMQSAMEEARARTFDVVSPDGTATVRVDGRSRVLDLTVTTRQGGRDPRALEQQLVAVLNDALTRARTETGAAVMESMPGNLRQSMERTTEQNRRDPRA